MPKLCPVCGASYVDAMIFCPTDGSSLRAAESDGDLIGMVVADRYLVTDLLGEGGMGKVYLARHVRLPQQAAIKVLRPAMLRDPAAVARFNREAANASRIEHEHIARVFDYGESADGTVYLAMEYVPGRTLKKIILVEGALSPERAATLTRQIGVALDAAHRLGIVHRDLKPDNVMVIEDPETGDRCKVVDFGIAKAVGGDAGEAGLTKTGFVVGTPEFMSPEQLLGGKIDHRSDVYALALLSFQCLTGSLPFDSTSPERAMTARLVDAPQTLANVMPTVAWPDEVQSVFNQGLARDVSDRYESAGAFARALESAVSRWKSGGGAGLVQDANGPTPADAALAAAPAPGFTAMPLGTPTDTLNSAFAASTRRSASARGSSPAAPTPSISPAVAASGKRDDPIPSGESTKGRGFLVAAALVGVLGLSAVAYMLMGRDDSGAGAAPLTDRIAEDTRPQPGDVQDESALRPEPQPDGRGTTADRLDGTTAAPQSQQQAANTARSPETVPSPRQNSSPVAPQPSAQALASTGGPDAARLELDSLRRALNPLTATPAEARRGVAALRALMPRLTTAEDSAWALIRQAEAHFIMVDERSACVAIKAATPLARTVQQRGVLDIMSESLSGGC